VLHAVIRERNAFDVFHDEEWSSVGPGIGIVQPGDGWMIELRKRALLDGKPVTASRRQPGIAKNFDCNLAAEILALGKVDDAHATFTERFQDSIGSESIKGRKCQGRIA
jgi:hypothetical protein